MQTPRGPGTKWKKGEKEELLADEAGKEMRTGDLSFRVIGPHGDLQPGLGLLSYPFQPTHQLQFHPVPKRGRK